MNNIKLRRCAHLRHTELAVVYNVQYAVACTCVLPRVYTVSFFNAFMPTVRSVCERERESYRESRVVSLELYVCAANLFPLPSP